MLDHLDIPNLNLNFADLKDPFTPDSFECLDIQVTRYSISARISFVDGHTEGNRTFVAPTLPNLFEQINDYYAALKMKAESK